MYRWRRNKIHRCCRVNTVCWHTQISFPLFLIRVGGFKVGKCITGISCILTFTLSSRSHSPNVKFPPPVWGRSRQHAITPNGPSLCGRGLSLISDTNRFACFEVNSDVCYFKEGRVENKENKALMLVWTWMCDAITYLPLRVEVSGFVSQMEVDFFCLSLFIVTT